MANNKRTHPERPEHDRRDPDDRDTRPEREGDVLGISDSPPEAEIPQAARNRGGHAQGIDVRGHASGIGDLRQSSGATGIDMGHAGKGTDITSHPRRPAASTDADDDNRPE